MVLRSRNEKVFFFFLNSSNKVCLLLLIAGSNCSSITLLDSHPLDEFPTSIELTATDIGQRLRFCQLLSVLLFDISFIKAFCRKLR